MAARFIKVGTVMKKKAPKEGSHVLVGDQYRGLTVTLVLTDNTGKEVARVDNPFLHVQNPRNRVGAKEEEIEKIPDFLQSELFLVID